MLSPTAHTDTFTRDNLPKQSNQPNFLLEEFNYPKFINAAEELTDNMVKKGFGDNIALIGNGRQRTYKELSDWTNRLANTLIDNYNLKPGNRILIRSANNPAMVACWLAATKVGAVVVNTMPLLRTGELEKIINKAEITHALCDDRLLSDLKICLKTTKFLKFVIPFDGTANHNSDLDKIALEKPVQFNVIKTGRDDVALLGFTSGTTGEPKATMHFHRDLLIIADCYAKEILNVSENDIFVGSPPLAFTFGLGGLGIFPLRFGATATLLENASPQNMIEIIQKYKATICFTAPTAYNFMLTEMAKGIDLSSLRAAISAGETLPATIYNKWLEKTGKPMLDGIGSTELLHIFISNRFNDHKENCTGKPVKGYEAKIVNDKMEELPIGETGLLAIRGPTGCRYLNDSRQSNYVVNGWNLTGDSFYKDTNGYFHFMARNDDIIISSGYNIAGPEVESALISHSAIFECAVIGIPDNDRGSIIQAHIVLNKNIRASKKLKAKIQNYVKEKIAPYKYPRSIIFTNSLPKTKTGKIQRYKLKKL